MIREWPKDNILLGHCIPHLSLYIALHYLGLYNLSLHHKFLRVLHRGPKLLHYFFLVLGCVDERVFVKPPPLGPLLSTLLYSHSILENIPGMSYHSVLSLSTLDPVSKWVLWTNLEFKLLVLLTRLRDAIPVDLTYLLDCLNLDGSFLPQVDNPILTVPTLLLLALGFNDMEELC